MLVQVLSHRSDPCQALLGVPQSGSQVTQTGRTTAGSRFGFHIMSPGTPGSPPSDEEGDRWEDQQRRQRAPAWRVRSFTGWFRSVGSYQIMALACSGRYILSPGFTPKAS